MSGSVTVQWTSTAHQTGAVDDYTPHTGSVSFTAGQSTADITLAISNDRQEEDLEVTTQKSVFFYLLFYLPSVL